MASGISNNYGNSYGTPTDYSYNQGSQQATQAPADDKTTQKKSGSNSNQAPASGKQQTTAKNTNTNGKPAVSGAPSKPAETVSKLPSPFEEKLAALKQIDTDQNGLTIGDLAKTKFDYEATSASGNLEDLAFLNMIGDVIGTEHPQSYDLERADAFIKEFDADGSGALEDAELQAAVESYIGSTGEEAPASGSDSEAGGTGKSGTGSSPYSLEDLDTNGDGIVDQKEMAALTDFVNEEVLGSAAADGTIDLGGSKGQTGSAPVPGNSGTGAPASSGASGAGTAKGDATGGLTGEDFITMYDIDGTVGLSTDEVTEIVTANEELIQTLTAADTDGKAGLSAAELQSIATTEVGQGLIASGITELAADELTAFIENLDLNNSILSAGDLDGDGIVTAEEVDTLLAELNGTPATGNGTSTSGTGTPTSGTGTPTSGTGTPTSGTGTPTSGTGTPTSGTGTPASGTGSSASAEAQAEAEQFTATYDLDQNGEISTEELDRGITVNKSYLDAFTAAETDGKAGLSIEEIKASAALSSLIPTDKARTAEEVEAYITLLEGENTLLETLKASGKPVTAAEILAAAGSTTPASGGTPTSGTPTGTSEAPTSNIVSKLNAIDWNDSAAIIKAFDTDGDGKLSLEKEITAAAQSIEASAATVKDATTKLAAANPSDATAYQKVVADIAASLQKAGLLEAGIQPDAKYLEELSKQFETSSAVLGSLAALDTDKDGNLTAEEFNAALSGTA